MGESRNIKTLLILDVDETLLHSAEKKLDRNPNCEVGPYYVYFRPGLVDFLIAAQRRYLIAFWSSSSRHYLENILQAAIPDEIEPAFIWSRERCVTRYDSEQLENYFVKDLRKVERKGFDLKKILIVDDTPQKVERHYGNAIYVKSYFGDESDKELFKLADYLETLASVSDVRTIEKRNWNYQ